MTHLATIGLALCAGALACSPQGASGAAGGAVGSVGAAANGSGGTGTAAANGSGGTATAIGSGGTATSAGQPGSAGAGGALPDLFDGKVEHSDHARPISGGTLLVTRDGQLAVAADPERDQVFLVDLSTHDVRAVALPPDSEAGRVAEGANGQLFVALRRAGAVAVIDRARASVSANLPVCRAPRGLAFDPTNGVLYVACRGGQLISIDGSSLAITRQLKLDEDLRDVVVLRDGLFVTRFRSAEFLVLNASGAVTARVSPAGAGCGNATVAYHAVGDGQGHVLVAHQSSSAVTVGTSIGGYGASCSGSVVAGQLSLAEPSRMSTTPPPLQPRQDPLDVKQQPLGLQSLTLANTGPFDVAVEPASGKFVAIALTRGTSESGTLRRGQITQNPSDASSVFAWDQTDLALQGEPVAVALDAGGGYIVQSREPATLEFEAGQRVALSDVSQRDTGMKMFYLNSGIGLACASCHPEGDEDGHTWHFSTGLRRTQPLAGGVLSRAPFHWTGELAGMAELVDEVMLRRMALPAKPSAEQVQALGSFLDGIQLAPVEDSADPDAVARGRELFAAPGPACSTCHSGPQLTDNLTHDVGTGGSFVTPTLLGAGQRRPLFHDGCAPALSARFGICGGGDRHGTTSTLSDAEAHDLLAYLGSL